MIELTWYVLWCADGEDRFNSDRECFVALPLSQFHYRTPTVALPLSQSKLRQAA
jgi:hypothetical protein